MQDTQVTISEFQRSVAVALAAVQHGFEEEYLEPRTGYSLDLVLPSSRVAVEVDGPSHFLLPDGRGVRKPNGSTLLKRRLLVASSWRLAAGEERSFSEDMQSGLFDIQMLASLY
ncbi:hypothetical protein EMIHUDRAFT_251391 [Emiliania huxleyi CCMP1516]|uniref:RAP domain-containing protein n=2 Tax=Emiliania huxleyi TaxID=2903 RepID=A0A0D3KVH9_EMIH1|nr:hypothetical protein EMIHUDRAFT_251391 [Emiliania huxleyi CCMP1516]EOD39764.1 hypothetical protein EMIHUDRAFT_251391 [Emiliania huxleyi CCMP1516]|eukprot:XP_005792193.1 hypothetical protein EMIHUDRAFT_251391 [Emiliania huxleyi CCMP1516]